MSEYTICIKPTFKKNVKKIKGEKEKENIINKMNEIKQTVSSNNENHYKNLKKPLQKFKRVNVNTSFVMIFEIDSEKKIITFYNYEHHDKIYR